MVEKEFIGCGLIEGGVVELEVGVGVRIGVEGGVDEDMCIGVICIEVVYVIVIGIGKNEILLVVDEKVGFVGVVFM